MLTKLFAVTVPAILFFALTVIMLGGGLERRAAIQVTAPGDVECETVSHNRSIDAIGFSPDPSGATTIELLYSLLVGDADAALLNFDADILIEVIVGGIVVSETTIVFEGGFVPNDAIVCAINCVSDCGSIFGDGTCTGCNCNYLRSTSVPGGFIFPGDVVRATILPAPGAAPEILTGDDSRQVTFADEGNVVTICHIPPGNPGNAHTICIGESAVPAHLAHGDTLGPCDAASSGASDLEILSSLQDPRIMTSFLDRLVNQASSANTRRRTSAE